MLDMLSESYMISIEILDEIIGDNYNVHILEPRSELVTIKKIKPKEEKKKALVNPPQLVIGKNILAERKFNILDDQIRKLYVKDLAEGEEVKIWLVDAFF